MSSLVSTRTSLNAGAATAKSANLFVASKQWASRPPDQRFSSLEELLEVTRGHHQAAATATVDTSHLRWENRNGEVVLTGQTGQPARLTHWAFGQLANRVGAPAEYLRNLPAPLAARNLSYGLRRNHDELRALFHRNGSLICRCVTSDKYARIWNYEIVERLLSLVEHGWRVPPARPATADQPGARPATAADVLDRGDDDGLSVKIGDLIAPAGLYASDHDMFAFLINEDAIVDDGSQGGLARGFFVSNSEVGAASLRFTRFLYRQVCGNHIVWGARDVSELRIVHRGAAGRRFDRQLLVELRRYADSAASEDEARIVAAKRFVIAATKDEVLDRLFAVKVLPRKSLEAAYEYAVEEADRQAAASPRSAWGFAQGLTRLSQESPFADERNRVDRAAGKVLAMAS